MSLISWFKSWRSDDKLRELQNEMVTHNLETGRSTPVGETSAGKTFRILASGECPTCHSRMGFFGGPSGGMSQNFYCKNPECTQGYNVTDAIGIAELIGKGRDKFPEWWSKAT